MSHVLEDSDTQSLLECLDSIYASPSDSEALKEALTLLKEMIETTEERLLDEDDSEEEDGNEEDGMKARPVAMKEFIFTTKPDLFQYLLKFPNGKEDDADEDVLNAKAELLAELVKGYPPSKASLMPLVDQLLVFSFREDLDDDPIIRAWASMARYPIAALLRPDPEAHAAHEAALKAFAAKIKSFDTLTPELKANEMDEDMRNKQKALVNGLFNVTRTPLEPDAALPFIESGALDALLNIIARGPLSPRGAETSLNSSLDDACTALSQLMDNAKPEVLAQALIDRQVVGSLIKQMTYICHSEDIIWASDVPRSLVVLAKSNETLLQQIVTEAQNILNADPNELGPGAPVVLWKLLDCATNNDIEDLEKKVSKSNKYVPFFLAAIEPSASENVLNAVSEALAARIGEPGRQLRNGIHTPEQVEKITQLVEYACTQSAPDISPAMNVLRELILPSSDKDTGGWTDPKEELKRANKEFWQTFATVMKTRLDAACALAPEVMTREPRDTIIEEPSELGQAHMKNVKVLVQLVTEQYTTMALLPDLCKYLQTLLLNPSPLSRRAGLELLTALTRDSSLSKDFEYVPGLIEGFKRAVEYTLSDPRKLLRAMALEWLNRLTAYRHPEAEDFSRYKPGVDFVLEVVTEDILVEMLKGTSDEVKVAAEMIQSMASRSIGTEVADRLKKNKELVEALWNGAPESQDQDISEDVFLYGNVESSSAGALSALLDPFDDLDSITQHITPHIAGLSDKDWFEFHGIVEKFPAVASLAVLKPETQVLSTTAKMTTHIEQIPFAMQLFREFSQGTMLAKVYLGQSDDVYPALVKVLQGEDESAKAAVLLDLDNLLFLSTVSKIRFTKEGGIKALLDIVVSDSDEIHTRYALATLQHLLDNFPEGVQVAINAGAIPILESRRNPDSLFDHAGDTLTIIESQKDAPLIDRIEFTPEAYAELGKKLPDPAVLERLTKNFESSMDEKQLGIAAGLASVLAGFLQSSSELKPVLKALNGLLVIDGQGWQGFKVVQRAAERCALPELLQPLMENEDEAIRELSEAVMNVIVQKHEDES
ncbi:unnamed protein product [Rhizoctonia solani]|uniref:ARM repeat-containing protein n=1 Tax=Rhizoctonia solani TaxID=456999 RepID=A0A8H2XM84_9AGAM|nr:unnamed protein product [Rhizoctonia solani]